MDPDALTNLAVSDIYEPGSTFKLVTYSAALDAAGVEPTDIVDCQGGAMTMYGRTLHDDKSDHFGRGDGAVRAGTLERCGRGQDGAEAGAGRSSTSYMQGFGFGDRSGIELPSETRGLLRPPRQLGRDQHPLARHRAGDRRDAGAAGGDGEHHRQRRRVSAAAHPAAVHGRAEGRADPTRSAAGGVSSGERAARAAAGRRASRDQRDDGGEDAQDDARHRDRGHGQSGRAERLQRRRQDGHGAEDRPGDAHLLARRSTWRALRAWRR